MKVLNSNELEQVNGGVTWLYNVAGGFVGGITGLYTTIIGNTNATAGDILTGMFVGAVAGTASPPRAMSALAKTVGTAVVASATVNAITDVLDSYEAQ